MERKLRYLEKEIKKDNISMADSGESPEAPQPREMIDLEVSQMAFQLFQTILFEIHLLNANVGNIRKTGERIARGKSEC